MGLMDGVRKLATKENIAKAKGLAAENADKISGAVGKATTTIDKRTGGRYKDTLDRVNQKVDETLEKTKDEGDGRNRPGDDGADPTGPR